MAYMPRAEEVDSHQSAGTDALLYSIADLPLGLVPDIVHRVGCADWPFLRQVSRHWREAVDSEVTKLAPTCFSEDIALRFPQLHTLDLLYCSQQSGPLEYALSFLPNLEELLNLEVQSSRRDVAFPVESVSLALNRVTKLTVSNTHHRNEPLKFTSWPEIVNWPDLRDLRIVSAQSSDYCPPRLYMLEAVTHLDLSGCRLTVERCVMVLESINSRNLKALKLGQTSRGKVGGINEMFYQRLAEFDSLLDLDLSCSSELNDTGIAHLNRLTKLTRLHLGNTHVSSHGCSMLTDLSKVADLSVEGLLVTAPFGFSHMLDAFQNLASLDISGCPQLKAHACFSRLTSLTCLNARDCWKFGSFKPLSTLTQLQDLTAGGTCDSDASMEGLEAFSRLTRLDLACTSATTVSARGLARLAGLTALRNLSLCGIYTLTDEAVSHLAALTLMTSLDLRMCVRLTNAALHSLKDLQQLQWLRFGMSTSTVACGEAVPGNLKMPLLRGLRVSHDWDHKDDKFTLP